MDSWVREISSFGSASAGEKRPATPTIASAPVAMSRRRLSACDLEVSTVTRIALPPVVLRALSGLQYDTKWFHIQVQEVNHVIGCPKPASVQRGSSGCDSPCLIRPNTPQA